MDDTALELRPIDGGYELSRRGATRAHPCSTDLRQLWCLESRIYAPFDRSVEYALEARFANLRFIQADYERRPSRSVPEHDLLLLRVTQCPPARRGRATFAGRAGNPGGDA